MAVHIRVTKHILIGHAITGCDTVSAMYGVGKKRVVKVLKAKKWRSLRVFLDPTASHSAIQEEGEKFILALYGAPESCETLDMLRYTQRVNKNSAFHIQQLPPTSAAAKYHVFRAYFAVQEWLVTLATYSQQTGDGN